VSPERARLLAWIPVSRTCGGNTAKALVCCPWTLIWPEMKIAVVGCGAVGSYYGGMLARLGESVHFLLRSDYDVVKRDGVHIASIAGDFHVRPLAAREPEEIGIADLVLIGLKSTANAEFRRLLPPLAGPQTAVLTLQNGLGNEEQLEELFSPAQILGGLCFVCLNRVRPGFIRHIAHGQIVMGEFSGPSRPRTHQIAAMFERSGVPCKVTEDLARAHWEKLVWNVPFNGLGVAGTAGYEAVIAGRLQPGRSLGPVLTTDAILGDSRWRALARALMLEVIGAARAQGFAVPDSAAEEQMQRTENMGPYKASTLLDFEKGLPLELSSLFLEPLRRGAASGAKVERWARLCSVLEQLANRN